MLHHRVIPMQDEPAEELYILCLEAMNRNRTVRCDIFPCRMSEQNMETLAKQIFRKINSSGKV